MTRATETQISAEIGRLIRSARMKSGMTLVALSMDLGISYQQLAKYESGRNRIMVRRLVEIARILRTDVAELMPSSQIVPDGAIDLVVAAALDRLNPDVRKRIFELIAAIEKSVRQASEGLPASDRSASLGPATS